MNKQQRKDVQINLRVPPELAARVDRAAQSTRTTRSWVIREALHRYFDGDGSDTQNPTITD
ncbi:MAG: ribbon-helix-helix domain-containing protein [Planctomycetes bacterium]|nr:ribbon-helix-helix domain-containing protein [Planctomycetota bacterium]